MSIIRRFLFSGFGQITAQWVDSVNYRIWIAIKNNNGCKLLVKSAFNPNDTFFEIDISADEITNIIGDSTYVYLSLDDDTYIGMRLSKSDPIGTNEYINIPSGINEKAIDLTIGNYLFFATPGTESGENPKILRFNASSLAYIDNIELTTIENVRSIDIDSNNDVWAVTYTSPITLVRIYDDGGYTYSEWDIL